MPIAARAAVLVLLALALTRCSAVAAAQSTTAPGARSSERTVRVVVTRVAPDRLQIRYVTEARQLTRILIDTRSGQLLGNASRFASIRVYVLPEGDDRLRIRYFDGSQETAQLLIERRSGRVLESRNGERGNAAGLFGRQINAPYVWLPLCAIFFLLFFDRRRPWRMVHLDLLVLLGFGVSHIFFQRGRLDISVPLGYPPLIYLLARMLWIGVRGSGPGLRPMLGRQGLTLVLLFLVAFRIVLNIAGSTMTDVGYAGAIGAHKLASGQTLYGAFPTDNPYGDTYGPVNYAAYVPFEQLLPWSGRWDSVPAAHAATIAFDLATIALLIALGRRLRRGAEGTTLGLALAAAWAAFPYTAYAMQCNVNDALVAALLAGTLLLIGRPVARGVVLALAAGTKFAPLALVPLMARADRDRFDRADMARFAAGFAVTVVGVMAWPAIDPGLSTFWDRTLAFQGGRQDLFSVWSLWNVPTEALTAFRIVVVGLAIVLAFVPRRRDVWQVAALCAAVLIAVQLGLGHWFLLYIPWFLPALFVALAAPEATRAVDGNPRPV
jgi:hypothetical protein